MLHGVAVLEEVPNLHLARCVPTATELVRRFADEAVNVSSTFRVAADLTDRPAVILNKLRPFVHARDRRLVHVDLGSRFLCPQRGA